MYPLASDRGGDLYCWDSETENIYYYCHEFIDEPNKVCDNIEEFFKLLDNSLEYMDEYYNYEVVTFKTALEKATEFVKNINNTYDIVSCIELDDAYVFTCMAESSEEEFKERQYGIEKINNKYYAVIHGGSSIEVSKNTGKTTYFILPNKTNFERLKNGKTINLFE